MKLWYNFNCDDKVNIKKRSWIILLISLFGILTTGVLFVIGCFSNYLINKIAHIIVLVFLIIFVLLLIYSLFNYINNFKRQNFKKWKVILFNILIGIYALGCSVFLVLLYGPNDNFREWLITTAMKTMNHQYYCKWFYNEDMINEVMENNFIVEVDEDTDPSLVDKNKNDEEEITYANEYEKEILEHEKDALYKIIRFKVNGQDAYLAAVYDASKIGVAYSKWLGRSGQYATDMAKEKNSPLAINGGGFYDPNHNSKGSDPLGVTIANGKIISDRSSQSYAYGGIIGFTNDDVLVLKRNMSASALIASGVRDAVTMGPFLIVNGKSSFIKGNGGWGYAARTAIGQRADGIVLFLVVDSNVTRTKGASMVDLTEIMQRYGAINAANLDGGTSSVMVENGELINDPIDSTGAHKTRGIPTIIYVKE